MSVTSRTVLLCLLLLAACGTRESKIERLPPPNLHDALPPPSVSAAPGAESAPAAGAKAAPDAKSGASPAAPESPMQSAATEPHDSKPAAQPSVAAADTPTPASQPADVSNAAPAGADTSAPAPKPSAANWPRDFSADGVAFRVYQPQVEAWDGAALSANSIVVATPEGAQRPIPGILQLRAQTRVDEAEGLVMLESLSLTDAAFPAAPDKANAWLEALRAIAAREFKPVRLAAFRSSADIAEALRKAAALRDNPVPRIVLSRSPAVLVAVDGDPIFVPVPDTKLTGVRNTRAVVLKDEGGRIYLRLYDAWVSAASLRGPWAVAKAPSGADAALRLAKKTGRAQLLEAEPDPKTGRKARLDAKALPLIVVTTKPMVLLVMDGEPEFAPIPGTSLRYVTNTQADVFRDVPDKKLYVLAEGSWYRSSSAAGPWERVPAEALPQDFSRIPADSPKAGVIASVFKTTTPAPAQLPAIAEVSRAEAQFRVTIDGNPRLVAIPGTQLNYVANASAPIVQLDRDHWYGFQGGVWFVADSVTGPWSVTDNVPSELYSIPPSSPVYHAVQARVMASSSSSVYYGYSAAYSQSATGTIAGVHGHASPYYYATPMSGMMWGWFY